MHATTLLDDRDLSTHEKLLDRILRDKNMMCRFQPIVSLRDATIFGYEALSRGPLGTPLHSPIALIETAQACKRSLELECLFHSTAFKNMKNLPPGANVFINVDPASILDCDFRQGFMLEHLRQFDIDPGRIVFEITERRPVNDIPALLAILEQYKAQNCRICMDDVGAGFSGLNLISDLRPQFIKLDQNLIRGIDRNPIKQALIRGMGEFAALTNTILIAEGIETDEELVTLIDFGIHYGQGYFIQRPSIEAAPIREEAASAIVKKNQLRKRK